jgi:hypothetical protein
VLPNENAGLLVEAALFVVLPKRFPPGVLPVDAPNAFPPCGWLPPPNSAPPDWLLFDVFEPNSPPLPPDVAPPNGEGLLPDEAGVPPPKLNAMLAIAVD